MVSRDPHWYRRVYIRFVTSRPQLALSQQLAPFWASYAIFVSLAPPVTSRRSCWHGGDEGFSRSDVMGSLVFFFNALHAQNGAGLRVPVAC